MYYFSTVQMFNLLDLKKLLFMTNLPRKNELILNSKKSKLRLCNQKLNLNQNKLYKFKVRGKITTTFITALM